MSLLITIVWALVGVLNGMLLLILVPWTAAKIAGEDWIEAVSDRYVWFAQLCARRSALIVRDGDIKLVPKRYDSDLKADKDTATGDKRHHRDEFDTVGRLKNKVFGFGLTKRDVYVSPLLAELGERAKSAVEREKIGVEEAPGNATGKMLDGIHVPKRSKLANLADARHLTTGSSEPEDGQESYKKTKISQEKFHEKVSFGQGMLVIVAFAATLGVAWFAASRDGGSTTTQVANNSTRISKLMLLSLSGGAVGKKLQELREQIPFARIGAWLWIVGWIVAIPILAGATYGLGTGLLVGVLSLLTAGGTLIFLALFAPSFPVFLGMGLARGIWILAQLTVGRGVLVERDTGELEHHQLRDAPENADHDFEATLSDGKVLEIDGSKADLFRFGWAPLGATAEKSDENMNTITVDVPRGAATDGGTMMSESQRQGWDPALRVPEDEDTYIVTLPQLHNWCKGVSESQAVRQGRQKALTEHGGEQQISMVVFMGILLMTSICGGLMGLIAGGAIP